MVTQRKYRLERQLYILLRGYIARGCPERRVAGRVIDSIRLFGMFRLTALRYILQPPFLP